MGIVENIHKSWCRSGFAAAHRGGPLFSLKLAAPSQFLSDFDKIGSKMLRKWFCINIEWDLIDLKYQGFIAHPYLKCFFFSICGVGMPFSPFSHTKNTIFLNFQDSPWIQCISFIFTINSSKNNIKVATKIIKISWKMTKLWQI